MQLKQLEWRSLFVVVIISLVRKSRSNPDAKRLYDDLMSNYNRIVRPVINDSSPVTVKLGLKLTQIIDLNLKNQILTTSMWVNQEWWDNKLQWDPGEYGGVETLYVPAEEIWLPDIVLYNNADGSYEITIMTKAIIHYNGRVEWNPPAIYKSYCPIDVQYFPFDTQLCFWKFSSWSYGGYSVDLKHITELNESSPALGMDLSEFYLNVEWDVMKVIFFRYEKVYQCCPEPYPNLFFNITIRRKTLFYTVNLIIPCLGISGLSVLVFYLPSDSGEKVSLTISILLSLNFFLLVLIEIIPSTSLTMPLLGKYLVFTMSLVTLSVVVTIVVLNVHFRSPSTHRMPPWVRKVFIHTLPKMLLMRPPQYRFDSEDQSAKASKNGNGGYFTSESIDTFATSPSATRRMHQLRQSISTAVPTPSSPVAEDLVINELDSSPGAMDREMNGNLLCYPREIEKAITNAMFIAQHIDNADEYSSVKEDWKYVAMVLDRIFLWIFTSACIIGTAGIFLQAPTLYDSAEPIDVKLSKLSRTFLEGFVDDLD